MPRRQPPRPLPATPTSLLLQVGVGVPRCEKALSLTVQTVGLGEFKVTGGREDHWVAILPHVECDCGDFIHREKPCAHVAAVCFFLNDEAVTRGVLGRLVTARAAPPRT